MMKPSEDANTPGRGLAQKLAAEACLEGRPLSWFDELYRKARKEGVAVPWDDRMPNRHMIPLVERLLESRAPGRALKVGCGYGDDAEWLASKGFAVTAFDVSPEAIEECRRRYPNTTVDYHVADLFDPPEAFKARFDLVWESYTLQALPPELREKAIAQISGFLAPGGHLAVVARARGESEPLDTVPWPLTHSEMDLFLRAGLTQVSFEDYVSAEDSTTRRFRACFRKGSLPGTGSGNSPSR